MIYNLWSITMANRRGKNGAGVIYNGNSCCELMLISYGFECCFERAHFSFSPSINLHFYSVAVDSFYPSAFFGWLNWEIAFCSVNGSRAVLFILRRSGVPWYPLLPKNGGK